MKNPQKNVENIGKSENEINAEKADVNEKSKPANDGFKSSDKSNGLTWEGPSDEQAHESVDLNEQPTDKESD